MIFECPKCKQWVEIWETDIRGEFYSVSSPEYEDGIKKTPPRGYDGDNLNTLLMICPDDGEILVEKKAVV